VASKTLSIPDRSTRRSTVLLADDHVVVREGLARLLAEHDFDVVGSVGDGHEFIEAAKRLRPDVSVTDISMPGLSGLEVLARVKSEHIDSKIIVLTMHDDADMATQAIRSGASGFLLKHSAGEELVNAIHQVLQGHVYLTPALTKDVMQRLATPSTASEPTLTARQREVLHLLLEGRRMKEIAAALDLSTRTVETHKYEIMRVLGVTSTAELVRYAIGHHLIVD
jgi:DNA-binding NarL/FixJ family response regulator